MALIPLLENHKGQHCQGSEMSDSEGPPTLEPFFLQSTCELLRQPFPLLCPGGKSREEIPAVGVPRITQ